MCTYVAGNTRFRPRTAGLAGEPEPCRLIAPVDGHQDGRGEQVNERTVPAPRTVGRARAVRGRHRVPLPSAGRALDAIGAIGAGHLGNAMRRRGVRNDPRERAAERDTIVGISGIQRLEVRRNRAHQGRGPQRAGPC